MSQDTAELIFYCVTGSMVLIWLVGIRFALGRLRLHAPREEEYGRLDDEDLGKDSILSFEGVVPGEAEATSKKVAELILAQSGLQGMYRAKITERTAKRISVELMSLRARIPGPPLRSVSVSLHQEGDKVRLRFDVDVSRLLTILRRVTWLVGLLYGGLFVIGTPVLIWTFVLPSEDPRVRMQVMQIFQMVHGVWPPFLLGAVLPLELRKLTHILETFLANLSHIT